MPCRANVDPPPGSFRSDRPLACHTPPHLAGLFAALRNATSRCPVAPSASLTNSSGNSRVIEQEQHVEFAAQPSPSRFRHAQS